MTRQVAKGMLHKQVLCILGVGTMIGCDGAYELHVSDHANNDEIVTESHFKTVSRGASHSCALSQGGKAYCWGQNDAGQLGDSTRLERSEPSPVAGGYVFKDISVSTGGFGLGEDFTCGVTRNNVGYCWGANIFGQLGNGSTVSRSWPVAVSDVQSFREITTGAFHACGLSVDGAVYCWGNSLLGQVGPFAEAVSRPLHVSVEKSFQTLQAGPFRTCGDETTGTTICWGFEPHNPRVSEAMSVDRTDGGGTANWMDADWSSAQLGDGLAHTCAGDINADGIVNVIDLGILLSSWNKTGIQKADLNKDGMVNIIDLGILLTNWTNTRNPPRLELLATGSGQTVALEAIDFGDRGSGSNEVRSVWVRNAGGNALCARLDLVAIDGSRLVADWPVSVVNVEAGEGTSFRLGEGEQREFRVRMEVTGPEGVWRSRLRVFSNAGNESRWVVGEHFKECPILAVVPASTDESKCGAFGRLLASDYLGIERFGMQGRVIEINGQYVVPTRTELYHYMEECVGTTVAGICVGDRRRQALLALGMLVDLGQEVYSFVPSPYGQDVGECFRPRAAKQITAARQLETLLGVLQRVCSLPGVGCSAPIVGGYKWAFNAAIGTLEEVDCQIGNLLKAVLVGGRRDIARGSGYFELRDAGVSPDQAVKTLKNDEVALLYLKRLGLDSEAGFDYLEMLWYAYEYRAQQQWRYSDGRVIALCAVRPSHALGFDC